MIMYDRIDNNNVCYDLCVTMLPVDDKRQRVADNGAGVVCRRHLHQRYVVAVVRDILANDGVNLVVASRRTVMLIWRNQP